MKINLKNCATFLKFWHKEILTNIKKMKKMRFIFLTICFMALVGTIIFQSCSKNNLIDDPIAETYVLTEPSTFEDFFVFPIGTELTIIGNRLNFKLPSGYQLITSLYDNTKAGNVTPQIVIMTKGSVTCNCTSGTGDCSPFATKKDGIGCLMGSNCSECTKTVSSGSVQLEILEATMVNLNIQPKFIIEGEEMKTIPSPSYLMFESEEVIKKLEFFLEGYNEDMNRLQSISFENIPDDYTYIPVRFLGKLILAPVMKSMCLSASLKVTKGGDKYSCSCSEGSGCVYGERRLLGIYYCDAGLCTSCTMTEN